MPLKNPYFSIIIPNYKTEPFLEQCLMSVKNQTFDNFECLLLNDGSKGVDIFEPNQITNSVSDYWYRKDYTNQYLPKKQNNQAKFIFDSVCNLDTRFFYFEHLNIGQGPTRNKGINLAKGKRIVFLDCDDFLEKNYLENVYNKLKQNPNIIYFAEINTYKEGKKDTFSSFQKHLPTKNNLSTMLVYPSWTINTVNYFWPLDFLKNQQIEYLGGKGEDTKFILTCVCKWYLLYPKQKIIFEKITNSGYNYRLFAYQNFRNSNFEKELFTELTDFVSKNLDIYRKIGVKYYFLAILYVWRYRLYNLRSKSKSFLKIIINIFAKFLTIISYLIADYR